MAVHVLRVDTHCGDLAVVAMLADDPDGNGPAEAVLSDPIELAKRHHALAAVNANAFSLLPDKDGNRPSRYRSGLPADIAGLAVSDGQQRSGDYGHAGNRLCFWRDANNVAHIGALPDPSANVREAVNVWWIDLVAKGEALPGPGGDRHPRTAVGLDVGRRWLFLVVVDGRQPGYSVGMTARELAELMHRLGAERAINLDGGGSSILLAADARGEPRIINRPSDGRPRPIPVLLGIRATGKRAAARRQ